MHLTVEIPDDLHGRMNAGGDLSRRALEALALEEYKIRHITKAELRRLLGFDTRYELDGFLKAHEVWIDGCGSSSLTPARSNIFLIGYIDILPS